MKPGAIDPQLKSQIDGLQSVIDNYQQCVIDLIDNPYADRVIAVCRLRIEALVAQKAELVKRV